MIKDNHKILYSIELTDDEIFVLSAFLGNTTVFGVHEKSFNNIKKNSKKAISSIKSKLETKGLIRYEIDGTLYIKKMLKAALMAISNPDGITIASSNYENGKHQTKYMIKSNENMISLERIGLSNLYLICVYDRKSYIDLINITRNDVDGFECKIPLDEVLKARNNSSKFSDNSLKDLFGHYCSNDVADMLSRAINTTGCYLILKVYDKNANEYQCNISETYVISDRQISVCLDNNYLCIKSVNFIDDFKNVFC